MTSLINPSNINNNYPIAGQDNDTQGFRTNFTNISNNLAQAALEISTLQANIIAVQQNVFYPNGSPINTGVISSNISAYLSTYTGTVTANLANVSTVVAGNVQANTITSNVLTLYSAIQFANLTSAQIANVTPLACGMTVYNFTSGNIQVYNGTKWANIVLS